MQFLEGHVTLANLRPQALFCTRLMNSFHMSCTLWPVMAIRIYHGVTRILEKVLKDTVSKSLFALVLNRPAVVEATLTLAMKRSSMVYVKALHHRYASGSLLLQQFAHFNHLL